MHLFNSAVIFNSVAVYFVHAQYSDTSCYNTECDLSPDALTNELNVPTPETCINTATGNRCFYTYVPECAGEDSPLVYDIHGFTACPLWNTYYTGWKELADEKCMVVVWPKGNVKEGCTSAPCWAVPGGLSGFEPDPEDDTVGCCCFKKRPIIGNIPILGDILIDVVSAEEAQDLAFLRSIASYVVRDLPLLSKDGGRIVTIDIKRIYMAGHSNGCMTSFAMAMVHSDLVAAVCCHAGSLLTPPGKGYVPTPIWSVHGQDDQVISYNGLYVEELGLGLFFPPQEAAFEYLRTLNGCVTVQNSTIDEGFILTGKDCTDGATVEFISLSGVGHSPYSNITSELGETTYNTTAAAWEFCSNYESASEPVLDTVVQSNLLLRLLKKYVPQHVET